MTLFTAVVSTGLLAVSTGLHLSGPTSPQTNAPALAAAFLMVLRAFGVVLLPPRGDLSGVPQAAWSVLLALLAAGTWWWVLDRTEAPAALAAALLLSWPQLIDGINAFADKVFHKAALAAGARDIAPAPSPRSLMPAISSSTRLP